MTINMGPVYRCPVCFTRLQLADSGTMYCPNYQCGGVNIRGPRAHVPPAFDVDDLARRIAREVVKAMRRDAAQDFSAMMEEETRRNETPAD